MRDSLPPPSRLLLCAVAGALLGSAVDSIHAYGDVLRYPDPVFGRLAFFVPIEFALLGVLAAVATPLIERAVGPAGGARWTLDQIAGELILFGVLYVATTRVPDETGAVWLALGLLGLAALRLAFAATPGDWVWALGGAVLGPAFEACLSATGAFEYLHPDVLGVPWWLPGLWANAGLFIRRIVVPLTVVGRPVATLPRR